MYHTLLKAVTLVLSIAASSADLAAAEPVATIVGKDGEGTVTYRGMTKGPVEHFLDIRYGQDTSGPRRFAPPEPYRPQSGSNVDATQPGPACPQDKAAMPPFFVEVPAISEDCLNLRIARPAGTKPTDNLPVVVHIVGGGVVKGNIQDPNLDPDKLIALSASIEKPLIVVTISHRLLMFGFARLPALKDAKSLNVGMRDQRLAYEWVKENIAAFGGDPSRVTAFGLSSGGTFSTLHLMTYGGEKGVPFDQVWAMSGPPGTALNMTSDATELHTRAVADKVGCSQATDEEILECLRGLPVELLTDTMVAHAVANHPPAGLFTFIPSIDEDFLPERQSVLYKAGRFVKDTPLVLAWTQDDGAANVGPAQLYPTEDSMKVIISSYASALTEDDYAALFALYPEADFAEDVARYEARKEPTDPDVPVHWFRVSRIMRDMLFTCSSLDFGREMTRQSAAGFAGVHVYALNQSILTPLLKMGGMPYVTVPHGSDMAYVLNGLFLPGPISGPDLQLAESMSKSLIQFAYTGSPSLVTVLGFQDWKPAFTTGGKGEGEELSQMNIQVIGGPLGTGPAPLIRKGAAGWLEEAGEMQIPLWANLEFGELDAAAVQARVDELDRERLFERCAFMNSLADKLGH